MDTKKSQRANLENKKAIMYMIGFVMVLSMTYIALEWSKTKVPAFKPIVTAQVTEDIIVDIPQTNVIPPPPPPPIQIIEEIKAVDNTIEAQKIDFTSEINSNEPVPDPGSYTGPISVDVEPEDIQIYAEIMPRFNGDVNKYLSENIKYPQIAIEIGLQGRVTCQFVVNRDGSIVDVEVVRGVDASLDKEALRVIKSMPKWKPGIQNGKPVRVKYYLPVNFKLM